MSGCGKDWNGLEEVTEVTEGLDWMLDGRRGLEEIPTRSSFRSSADSCSDEGLTLLTTAEDVDASQVISLMWLELATT